MDHETPLCFSCNGAHLYGMLHAPAQPANRGVLVIVGGPQYRSGSHRQFVLLARDLAAAGIPVLRFDYRGMGDSEGECGQPEPCEHLHDDIYSAVDTFFRQAPGLHDVVIWGLCDGASAALLHAGSDPRISGLVLLNPWVSTAQGSAKTRLKHYYLDRLLSPQLWRKIAAGEFSFWHSAASLWCNVRRALAGTTLHPTDTAPGGARVERPRPLAELMAEGLASFRGPVLLILSGDDLIGAEFRDVASASEQWSKSLKAPRVTRRDLVEADHSFSRREWRDQVMRWTRDWVQSW